MRHHSSQQPSESSVDAGHCNADMEAPSRRDATADCAAANDEHAATRNETEEVTHRPSTEKSAEVCHAAGVEVSVVGSPEVFGRTSGPSPNPDSEDERPIERCDLLSQSGDSLCLPTSDPRPPKKRFIQMADLPRSRPLHSQPSAFVEPPKQCVIPMGSGSLRESEISGFWRDSSGSPSVSSKAFQHQMNQWDWAQVDMCRIPVVFREGERYAAVHIVQLKLLSKFPPNIPPEMTNRYTMVSHKMSSIEAWIFNSINAVITKFDFGCQLFTPNDEIVRLVDVERFYWSVKVFNLTRMTDMYAAELRKITTTCLTATVTTVKSHVEEDLKEARRQLTKAHEAAIYGSVPAVEVVHLTPR